MMIYSELVKVQMICLVFLFCGVLSPFAKEVVKSDKISWGKVDDNISCGIKTSKDKYTLGEKVDVEVFLKNLSLNDITVYCGWISASKQIQDGSIELYLLVEYEETKATPLKQLLKSGESTKIVSSAISACPENSVIADLNFAQGSTTFRVICTSYTNDNRRTKKFVKVSSGDKTIFILGYPITIYFTGLHRSDDVVLFINNKEVFKGVLKTNLVLGLVEDSVLDLSVNSLEVTIEMHIKEEKLKKKINLNDGGHIAVSYWGKGKWEIIQSKESFQFL